MYLERLELARRRLAHVDHAVARRVLRLRAVAQVLAYIDRRDESAVRAAPRDHTTARGHGAPAPFARRHRARRGGAGGARGGVGARLLAAAQLLACEGASEGLRNSGWRRLMMDDMDGRIPSLLARDIHHANERFACALLSSCSSCSLSFYYSFQVNFFNTLHARRSSRYPFFIVVRSHGGTRREGGLALVPQTDRAIKRRLHDDNSTASSVASFRR